MFGPIRQVVFDFDGTLVNTMPSVIKGLGGAVEATTGARPSDEELLMSFGPAPQAVLEKWIPAEKVRAALKFWLDFEHGLGPEDMMPFTGVADMLGALHANGIAIGVFTGRDRAGTLKIARHHGWLGNFFAERAMVCGDDGLKPKPEPDALAHLLKTMNWNAATTLMVGDHPYDMMAGRAAGTKTAAALWDLPPAKTPRASFRTAWQKWDGVECDLRLATPKALIGWLGTSAT